MMTSVREKIIIITASGCDGAAPEGNAGRNEFFGVGEARQRQSGAEREDGVATSWSGEVMEWRSLGAEMSRCGDIREWTHHGVEMSFSGEVKVWRCLGVEMSRSGGVTEWGCHRVD